MRIGSVLNKRPKLTKEDNFQNVWFSQAGKTKTTTSDLDKIDEYTDLSTVSGSHTQQPQPTPAPSPRAATTTQGMKKLNPLQQNFDQIRQFAYEAFDKLDTNSNGFIETHELYDALNDPKLDMREKSYVTFLLTNQKEIAESVNEGIDPTEGGISRLDIELYFKLAISRLSQ